MATSSIFHNIVINDPAKAETFVAALEASEADPYKRPEGPITQVVTDKAEILKLRELRRKRREHEQWKTVAPLNAPNISAVDAISGVLAGKVPDDIDRHSLREMRLSRYALDD